MPEITPQNLKADIEAGNTPYILDVREQNEIDTYRLKLDNVHHISMGAIMKNRSLIPLNTDIILVCELGSRCERVAKFLTGHGHSASHLVGGLKAWRALVGQ